MRTTAGILRGQLQELNDDEPIVFDYWLKEDIQEVAYVETVTLSDEETELIMDELNELIEFPTYQDVVDMVRYIREEQEND